MGLVPAPLHPARVIKPPVRVDHPGRLQEHDEAMVAVSQAQDSSRPCRCRVPRRRRTVTVLDDDRRTAHAQDSGHKAAEGRDSQAGPGTSQLTSRAGGVSGWGSESGRHGGEPVGDVGPTVSGSDSARGRRVGGRWCGRGRRPARPLRWRWTVERGTAASRPTL
jgi:hypothetical protein